MKPSHLLILFSIVITGCCSWTEASSQAAASKLELGHLAFIDKYTPAVRPSPSSPPPLPASFENEVTAQLKDFDDAASQARWCNLQKQIFVNDKALFQLDAGLVRQQHYFTKKGADNSKAQIRKNYEGLATTSAATSGSSTH